MSYVCNELYYLIQQDDFWISHDIDNMYSLITRKLSIMHKILNMKQVWLYPCCEKYLDLNIRDNDYVSSNNKFYEICNDNKKFGNYLVKYDENNIVVTNLINNIIVYVLKNIPCKYDCIIVDDELIVMTHEFYIIITKYDINTKTKTFECVINLAIDFYSIGRLNIIYYNKYYLCYNYVYQSSKQTFTIIYDFVCNKVRRATSNKIMMYYDFIIDITEGKIEDYYDLVETLQFQCDKWKDVKDYQINNNIIILNNGINITKYEI